MHLKRSSQGHACGIPLNSYQQNNLPDVIKSDSLSRMGWEGRICSARVSLQVSGNTGVALFVSVRSSRLRTVGSGVCDIIGRILFFYEISTNRLVRQLKSVARM